MAPPKNLNWPFMAVQVGLDSGLNQTYNPGWVDFTPRLWSLGCDRGRQYELDQVQAGLGKIVFDDHDEWFNPANTASPYAKYILPYRASLAQTMWPSRPTVTVDRIVYRQTSSAANGTGGASSFTVPAPAGLNVGDTMLLFVGVANAATVTAAPIGWSLLVGPTVKGTALTTYVYQKTAAAADVAASFAFTLSGSTQYSAVCVAMAGFDGPAPATLKVTASAGAAEGSTAVTTHTTTAVGPTQAQSVVLSFFARAVSNDPTAWASGPAGDTLLAFNVGGTSTVGNNVPVVVAASPIVGAGSYTKSANTDAAASNCTMTAVAVSVMPAVNLLWDLNAIHHNEPIDPTFASYPDWSVFNDANIGYDWITDTHSNDDLAPQGLDPGKPGPLPGSKSYRLVGTDVADTWEIYDLYMRFEPTTVPGQAYNFSVYVWVDTATTTMALDAEFSTLNTWDNDLSVINTGGVTGQWVRLSVPFIAWMTNTVLELDSTTASQTGIGVMGNVWVSCPQLEPIYPLNANPSPDADTSSWTAHNCTMTISDEWCYDGLRSLKIVPDGVSAQCWVESEQVPVTAGQWYLVDLQSYVPGGIVTPDSFSLSIHWYDASHNFLSATDHFTPGEFEGHYTGLYGGGNTGQWSNLFKAPVGAAYATVAPKYGSTPPASQVAYLDRIRIFSSQPSQFAYTGPTIHGIQRGYIERWPEKWNHKGMYGYAETTTVDAFAVLAAAKSHTELKQAILNEKPDYYWPLNEPSDTFTYGEQSGNNGPPMLLTDRETGFPGNPVVNMTAGNQADDMPGDPGMQVIQFSGATSGPANYLSVRAGTPTDGKGFKFPAITDVMAAFNAAAAAGESVIPAYSWCIWAKRDPQPAGGDVAYILTTLGGNGIALFIYPPGYNAPQQQLQWLMTWPGNYNGFQPFVCDDLWADGKWHLYSGVMQIQDNGDGTYRVYWGYLVDGVQVTSNPSVTWSPGFQWTSTYVDAGGNPANIGPPGVPPVNGEFAHLAMWSNTMKWEGPMQSIRNAGTTGFAGENSGDRFARLLGNNFNMPTVIDKGSSALGVSPVGDDATILDVTQGIVVSENGNMWCQGDGSLVFRSRANRYNAASPLWIFGERQDLGEFPYEDDIAFDLDPTLVYNSVEVEQVNGIKATALDKDSQASYGPRAYQRTVNLQSTQEVNDTANWILATHKDPSQRVANLTIKPSHNPFLWPVALGAEVGHRVRVMRRTRFVTMQADYYIEQISHSQKRDEWVVQFQLSPATLTEAWRLGYSPLGVDTRLGY